MGEKMTVKTSGQGMTARFAEFVEDFEFEQVPEAVRENAKHLLYDGLGSLLGAASPRFDIVPLLGRWVSELGGSEECQIFGTSLRTDCNTAALVNGTLGYYCDIEPHHPGAIMHAIAVVGPAAMGVGEKLHSPGRDVLAALVLGTDVACRVSYALDGPTLYARGFHPTCVAGTFGSMAAASHLFGLKGRPLLHAFGLAGTQTSGLLSWVDDPTENSRPFNMGLGSFHGVRAAHLAACGFGGPPAIFEGKYPLGDAFSGTWKEDELFKNLGGQYKLTELYFKKHACCAFTHPGLDGLLDIMGTEGVESEDIQRMTLRFPKSGYKIIDDNPLRSHCAQYVLAVGAHKGAIDFYDILHDQRSDPRIRTLSENIRVIGDEGLDETYPDLYRSILDVETKDGACHTRDVTYPKGSPENQLSRDELKEKFLRLTADVLPAGRADEIEHAVFRIDELDDIRSLIGLLAADS